MPLNACATLSAAALPEGTLRLPADAIEAAAPGRRMESAEGAPVTDAIAAEGLPAPVTG